MHGVSLLVEGGYQILLWRDRTNRVGTLATLVSTATLTYIRHGAMLHLEINTCSLTVWPYHLQCWARFHSATTLWLVGYVFVFAFIFRCRRSREPEVGLTLWISLLFTVILPFPFRSESPDLLNSGLPFPKRMKRSTSKKRRRRERDSKSLWLAMVSQAPVDDDDNENQETLEPRRTPSTQRGSQRLSSPFSHA